MASQFVIFFVTALVSALMQEAYRGTTSALRIKEQNIRWLKEMRNRIIDNMHSGLVTTDERGVIRFANQMAGRLLQQDNSQLLGLNAADVLGIDLNLAEQKLNWPQRTEVWLHIDDEERLIGVSYSPLEFQPTKTGYLAVFQDLTEIKSMEQEHRFKDKMAAVGRVAAGVAHEIRNPLASIKGSIQVLREFVPEDRDAEELMDIVEKESNRLNDIISTFLEYSRPPGPADMRELNLIVVFREFCLLAAKDEVIRQLTLEVETIQADACILGDQAKLQQLFWNIVRNAGQASRSGGRVRVEFDVRGDEVLFSVRDYGCGMSEEQLADLFTPFQSFRKGGSGLGMSIVYEIVQIHRGRIEVLSELNKGTTVNVYFPFYKEISHGAEGADTGR